MNYDAATNNSPEHHTEFTDWLSAQTVAALQAAQGNTEALQAAVKQYYLLASQANLGLDEIEDLLGVNEPSIMDLAELTEADEEILVDAFEALINS